jgi:hypothetical protein
VEENRLKRCLKGKGVDSDTPGGGWICLSVAGCVTHKHLWKLSHLSHGEIVLVTIDDDILSYKV